MKIYVDSGYNCHTENDGTMLEIEESFFDGKCKEFIEGYCYKPDGCVWVRENGDINDGGKLITPRKDYNELLRIQAEYEHKLLEQFKAELADADAALAMLGVNVNA